MNCTLCNKEVEIQVAGSYSDILSCGHITTKVKTQDLISKGLNAVEASKKSNELSRISELPKVDGNELVSRVLQSMTQSYEDFFTTENPRIEQMLEEHGKENTLLIMTAMVAHMSRVLFCTGRFKNLYVVNIEKLRKEIEDKAVKELISNTDFNFDFLAPKPKKVKTVINTKTGTEIDNAKKGLGALTGKDGKPLDITKVMASMMWKQDKKKEEYKEGLDKIKDSITSKSSENI